MARDQCRISLSYFRKTGPVNSRKKTSTRFSTSARGGNLEQADGDITEAIDFCRYYATQMHPRYPKKLAHTPGETSHYHYIPRGWVRFIAP